jgi:hypothetical protein
MKKLGIVILLVLCSMAADAVPLLVDLFQSTNLISWSLKRNINNVFADTGGFSIPYQGLVFGILFGLFSYLILNGRPSAELFGFVMLCALIEFLIPLSLVFLGPALDLALVPRWLFVSFVQGLLFAMTAEGLLKLGYSWAFFAGGGILMVLLNLSARIPNLPISPGLCFYTVIGTYLAIFVANSKSA